MLGLTFDKIILIAFIAAVLIGPRRLPAAAGWLGRAVRSLRSLVDETKSRVETEIGDDFDWQQLDPRRYDPRRIIRDALTEDPDSPSLSSDKRVERTSPGSTEGTQP